MINFLCVLEVYVKIRYSKKGLDKMSCIKGCTKSWFR